jgi:hypothetical protein
MMRTLQLRSAVPTAVLVLLGLSAGLVSAPNPLPAQTPEDSIYEQWEEAIAQRRNGQFAAAIATLQAIIAEHADEEEVLRRAYNHLVFTYWVDRSNTTEREVAREALTRFPDLAVDTIEIPAAIDDIYAELRREMFGAVTIRKPEGCTVSLDGEVVGETPLLLPYVPVGEYDLLVVKEGYHPYEERVSVDPDGRHNFEISMSRQRGWGWWALRVGGGIAASTTVGLLLGGGSSGTDSPEPLAGPPAPPGS